MYNLLLYIALCVIYTVSFYKIFAKAGRKSWEALIPGYNIYVWIKICEKPWWWTLLFLFPGVNILMICVMNVNTAIVFGQRELKDSIASVVIPFVYLPKLAFREEYKYVGQFDRANYKKSTFKEWGDALIFAVIAASIIRTYCLEAFTIPTSSMEKTLLVGDYLFVSKMSYGPKVPNTPLSFPFAHHTLPFTTSTKSYLEWMKLPYFRLPGYTDVERNDIVVFNFPEGDTVIVEQQNQSYYQVVRDYAFELKHNDLKEGKEAKTEQQYTQLARKIIAQNRTITVRPVDKRENYIKRCVAVSGDKVQIKNGILSINDERAYTPVDFQYNYLVYTKDLLNKEVVKEKYDVAMEDMHQVGTNTYYMPLTISNYNGMKEYPTVTNLVPKFNMGEYYDPSNRIFPNDSMYKWTEDNFGPMVVPKKGETVDLTSATIPFYRRIISLYEGNTLEEKDGKFIINGKEESTYTFKMNYYFMMGDNRHNSADGRYWGFVPEDHIVGKASFIWLSLDKELGLSDGKIRWNRLFTLID